MSRKRDLTVLEVSPRAVDSLEYCPFEPTVIAPVGGT